MVVDRVPRWGIDRPPRIGVWGLWLAPRSPRSGSCVQLVGPRVGSAAECHTSIGIEPLVLELSTGVSFRSHCVAFRGLAGETLAFCVLIAGLVALSWIDLRTKRLPREITYTTLAIGVPLLVRGRARGATSRGASGRWCSVQPSRWRSWGSSTWPAEGGMGDGDVRLVAAARCLPRLARLRYVPGRAVPRVPHRGDRRRRR